MDTSKLVPAGITVAIAYALAHFSKHQIVKAAAYGVIGVVVAKQLPVVQNGLA